MQESVDSETPIVIEGPVGPAINGKSDEPELESKMISFQDEEKQPKNPGARHPIGLIVVSHTCSYVLFFVVCFGITFATIYGVRQMTGGVPLSDKPHPGYSTAAVAADTSMCSIVGKDILLKGGNAVDAAIASLVCTGLGSPQSMGVGGGFFMTIYNRTTQKSTIIDAREVAPLKATDDMFVLDKSNAAVGGLSVAVPGEVQGYWYTHQKYGKLPWAELFKSSIKLARHGFPVSRDLVVAMEDQKNHLLTERSLKSLFYNEQTGALLKEGEIIKMPELANTLQAIADGGAVAFYDGSLTGAIMDDLKDIGSIITREDLLTYKVKEKTPVQITLRNGVKVITPPAPSGGPVLSFILNILDGFAFKHDAISSLESRIQTYHKIIETFKFAFAKRTHLGDSAFIDIEELLRNLTSREYADGIRGLIDSKTYEYMHYGPSYYATFKTSTSHLTVMDKDGSAVSVTSTINARFGSKRRGMRTGIIFNNEMDDFSTPNITNEWGIYPSPVNYIQPGKRPLSSMCPAIFIDNAGSVSKTIGAAGGSMITTSVAWVAAHLLWLGKNVEDAVNMPRLHHQLLPPSVQYEQGFEKEVIQGLINIGHNVTDFKPGRSIIHAINVWNKRIFAKSDTRKGGLPDGY